MRKILLAAMYAGSALIAGTLSGPAAAGPPVPRGTLAAQSAVTLVDGYRYHYRHCCYHRPPAYQYYAPRAYEPGPAYYAPPVVYYPPPVIVYPPPVVVGGYAAPPYAYGYEVEEGYAGYRGYFGGW
jgi:hypothetical protein